MATYSFRKCNSWKYEVNYETISYDTSKNMRQYITISTRETLLTTKLQQIDVEVS